MIGLGQHIHLVLDNDDPVSPVDQPVKNIEQPANIVEVETRGRLIQEKKQSSSPAGHQHPGGQLQTLGLAAGESVERLSELQVAETQGSEKTERLRELLLMAEKDSRIVDGQLENLVNIELPVPDPQHLLPEPASVTGLTGQRYIG